MFLFWYGFSWFACYNWNDFFVGGFVTCVLLSFHRKSSFGFGIRNFVLTFCRCSMNFFVYFNLLLGFVISTLNKLYYYFVNNDQKGIVREHQNNNNSNEPKKPNWIEKLIMLIRLYITKLQGFRAKYSAFFFIYLFIPRIIGVSCEYIYKIYNTDFNFLIENYCTDFLLNFNSHYQIIIEDLCVPYVECNFNLIDVLYKCHLYVLDNSLLGLTALCMLLGYEVNIFNTMGPKSNFLTMNNPDNQETTGNTGNSGNSPSSPNRNKLGDIINWIMGVRPVEPQSHHPFSSYHTDISCYNNWVLSSNPLWNNTDWKTFNRLPEAAKSALQQEFDGLDDNAKRLVYRSAYQKAVAQLGTRAMTLNDDRIRLNNIERSVLGDHLYEHYGGSNLPLDHPDRSHEFLKRAHMCKMKFNRTDFIEFLRDSNN